MRFGLTKGISEIIKPAARDFLRSQRLAIASTVEKSGRVWASLLTGEPGFVQAVDMQTVWINALPVNSDPLSENLLARDEIGILVIDIATRRRLRVNGKTQVQSNGIYVHMLCI